MFLEFILTLCFVFVEMKGEPKWVKKNGIFSVLGTENTLLV